MEKSIYKVAEYLPCSCPMQSLLTPGVTCEHCMGLVAEPEPVPSAGALHDRYDRAYFEALERLYEDVEFAA
jgi:hypothetical protein